ncbi:hypothetical protein SISNIDRAFT_485500 [Sistotremastrum niveocremeum HHB9708]|uniref:Uncharacterized protein n=1 Tax=Sistotremastrum niveocremeum HHB9708 TaxID=1314777 RepID=A0A164UH47_9AGAM|nr:hypothetical protein SISNIDRAFT_485500 [Sistotremastrum niveocremeum HHB9708]
MPTRSGKTYADVARTPSPTVNPTVNTPPPVVVDGSPLTTIASMSPSPHGDQSAGPMPGALSLRAPRPSLRDDSGVGQGRANDSLGSGSPAASVIATNDEATATGSGSIGLLQDELGEVGVSSAMPTRENSPEFLPPDERGYQSPRRVATPRPQYPFNFSTRPRHFDTGSFRSRDNGMSSSSETEHGDPKSKVTSSPINISSDDSDSDRSAVMPRGWSPIVLRASPKRWEELPKKEFDENVDTAYRDLLDAERERIERRYQMLLHQHPSPQVLGEVESASSNEVIDVATPVTRSQVDLFCGNNDLPTDQEANDQSDERPGRSHHHNRRRGSSNEAGPSDDRHREHRRRNRRSLTPDEIDEETRRIQMEVDRLVAERLHLEELREEKLEHAKRKERKRERQKEDKGKSKETHDSDRKGKGKARATESEEPAGPSRERSATVETSTSGS